MTSAPMSASINVQVGPAMTCVRSTTFNPLRGPIVSAAILLFLLRLVASPLRLALIEEGIHAFTEIPALIAHQDQVLVLASLRLHAMQSLLGGTQRQRCIARDKPRLFIGPSFEGGEILHDFVKQTDAEGFLGFDQARGKNDLLEPRCPDQGRESADIGRRQAVAECARDRKSEFRGPGSNAEVTARGDPGAAAGANAVDRRNRRHLALFER